MDVELYAQFDLHIFDIDNQWMQQGDCLTPINHLSMRIRDFCEGCELPQYAESATARAVVVDFGCG